MFLTLISSTTTMSQSLTFDDAVRRLYFGVDIFNASSSLVDTFMAVEHLHYNDTVTNQWSLNSSIGMNSDGEAWSARHAFSFTKSPIPETKIKSGRIVVTILESSKSKKLYGIDWRVDCGTKEDAENFYNRLKEIFSPLSTKNKVEFDPLIGHIAQYSTRDEHEKGVKDITILYGKSVDSKRYQIILSLSNEFKFNDEYKDE